MKLRPFLTNPLLRDRLAMVLDAAGLSSQLRARVGNQITFSRPTISVRVGERRWHTAIPLAVAGVAYLLLSGTHNFPMVMALLIVGGGCMFGYYPVFWSMPTLFLSESAAAACFGLINSVGHTGGFIGPSAVGYLNDRTGSMTGAFLFIGACYVLASCIVPAIKMGRSVSPTMPILLTQKEIPERGNNPICWVESDRGCS